MADPVNYCNWLLPSMCLAQSEWAAWAQAIMSALAIWYSGSLAFNQTRRAKREKIDTYVAILQEADDAAQLAIGVLSHAAEDEYLAVCKFMDFAGLERSFRDISFHDVPDYRLVYIIREAADCCEALRKRYDDKADGSEPFRPYDYALAKPQAEKLATLLEEAERISNSLMTSSEKIGAAVRKCRITIGNLFRRQHQKPPQSHAD